MKHWQEKHELQTDYANDPTHLIGQIQHTHLNIQEYCLDFHDKQLVWINVLTNKECTNVRFSY